MRLARPRLAAPVGATLDPLDAVSKKIEDMVADTESAKYPIGEMLLAPQQFENIYLGETFSFFINCVNDGRETVSDMSVKVELQTSSQRLFLPCSVAAAVFDAGASLGQVISHEVKEAGQHILVCTAIYKTKGGEVLQFRKFFKFPVSKPIDVKTKFYNAEDILSCDVFLEAQICNECRLPMLLEKVSLEPSAHYNVSPILPPASFPALIQPNDIRQVLFALSPKNGRGPSQKDITTIGILDMEWRTSMGEKKGKLLIEGHLQTSALQRIAPGYGELCLTMDSLPATVTVRKPFEVSCTLHNSSDHSLDLHLRLDSSLQSWLVFCCPSGVSLGQIPPNGSTQFKLTLLPVAVGFLSITGIRVEDVFSKRRYEYDDIAQVFVI